MNLNITEEQLLSLLTNAEVPEGLSREELRALVRETTKIGDARYNKWFSNMVKQGKIVMSGHRYEKDVIGRDYQVAVFKAVDETNATPKV